MSIKEQLVTLGPEKLADLLLEFSANNKVIKKQPAKQFLRGFTKGSFFWRE